MILQVLTEAERRLDDAESARHEGSEELRHEFEAKIHSLESQLSDEKKHGQALEDRQNDLRKQISELEVRPTS